jgi:hypothetical protein
MLCRAADVDPQEKARSFGPERAAPSKLYVPSRAKSCVGRFTPICFIRIGWRAIAISAVIVVIVARSVTLIYT